MDKKTKARLDDLADGVEAHYSSSEDGSPEEATWHQQRVLLEIAMQLAEINVNLSLIVKRMENA